MKFGRQRMTQHIPTSTCPLIDDIQVGILDGKPNADLIRQLEEVREANHQLRLRGIEWYELCRDLLDDLEMTLKLRSKMALEDCA